MRKEETLNRSVAGPRPVEETAPVDPIRHFQVSRCLKTTNRGVILYGDGAQEEIVLDVTPVLGATLGEQYRPVVFKPGEQFLSNTRSLNNLSSATTSGESHSAQLEPKAMRHMPRDYAPPPKRLAVRTKNCNRLMKKLGTTNEKPQSANAELATVNEELQNRNRELSSTNSDLTNLLAAVNAAILMVDSHLRVPTLQHRRREVAHLRPTDIGQLVGSLRSQIKTPNLENQIRKVIETLHIAEEHVQDNDGHWYSVRARPYRNLDDRIGGAVITIQDIDPLKRGLEAAEEARNYAEGMIETVREPLVVLDADLRVIRATPAFYETFLVSREETQGRFLYDLGNGQWNRRRLRELIGSALFRNEPFQDYEIQHDFPHIGRRTMRLNARRIPRQDAQHRTLLLAVEDLTVRREAAEIRFQRLFETAKDAMMIVEAETGIVLDVDPYLLSCTGFAREDVVGKKLAEAGPFLDMIEASTLISSLTDSETIRHDEIELKKSSGGTIPMELVANLYHVGSQPVAQLNFRDVTQRKDQEESLRRSVEEKAVLVREIHHRVKNNLQVIVSLLNLQANYTNDQEALAAFEDMEGRVRAIAHIHETLYAIPDLAQIEFAAYLANLVRELLALHSTVPNGIALGLKTEEMVLDMEQAIPLGLVANELILNALKHGLAEGRGRLEVALTYKRDRKQSPNAQSLDNGWAQLRVFDSGPGLRANIDLSQARSMGFQLLNLLSKQLRGKVTFGTGPGATVCVEFPLSLPVNAND